MTKEIKERAVKDFYDLQNAVKTLAEYENNDLVEIYKQLRGHNWCGHEQWFDVNYGSICATIYKHKEQIFVSKNSIEVWNGDDCYGLHYLSDLESENV